MVFADTKAKAEKPKELKLGLTLKMKFNLIKYIIAINKILKFRTLIFSPKMKFAILLLIFINSGLLIAQKGKWQQFPMDFDNDLHGIYFIDSLTGYICGENGLILKTIDGINWLPQVTPTTNTLYDLHFIRDTLGWACGDNGTIINTMDGGNTWELQSTSCERQLVSIEFYDYETGFTGWAVGDSSKLIKYYEEPTWLGGGYIVSCNYHFVTYQHPSVYNTLFMCFDHLYTTSNNGITWTFIYPFGNDQLAVTKRLNYNIGNWSVNFWTVGKSGSAFSFDQPFLGWPFYQSNTPDTLDLFSVAVDQYAHKVWAIGENGRILLSEDEGANYYFEQSPATENLNDICISGFETGYIVGDNGTILYYKEEWLVSNANNSLELIPSIYPNPFKSNTTIKLNEKIDKTINIRIFDLQGKLVKDLKNEISANRNDIFWDGKNNVGNELINGVYIIRIKTTSQSKSIKLIKF